MYVLFDAWYASESLLNLLEQFDWQYITRVKKNRLFNGVRIDQIFRHHYSRKTGNLKKINHEILIVKDGEQSLGRSGGGHSTKIYPATDALGNAIRFILTGGQRNDITQGEQLIENLLPDYVIADKGYDADALVLLIRKINSEAVIPSKINRKVQREINLDLYKERHLVQCCIGKLKHFRRVFSRFDKLAKNYLSFVQFAGTIVWLR